MGLSIQYEFKHHDPGSNEAVTAIYQLHKRAKSLPLQDVSAVRVFTPSELRECEKYFALDTRQRASHTLSNPKHPFHFWLWVWLSACERLSLCKVALAIDINPTDLIAFSVHPGEGCEPATIGLARYPATIEAYGLTWPTGLDGWRLRGACKTQFASIHGDDYFVKCHIALCELFDAAKDMGFDVKVTDQGRYYSQCDKDRLLEELKHMNRQLAAIAGAFKDDPAGYKIISPILEHPHFEKLENEGMQDPDIRKMVTALKTKSAELDVVDLSDVA